MDLVTRFRPPRPRICRHSNPGPYVLLTPRLGRPAMSACAMAGGAGLSRPVRASASNQELIPERGVRQMSERRNLAVACLLALSLGGAGAASAQEIKLTLADQNS